MEELTPKKSKGKLIRKIFGWISLGSGIALSLFIIVNSSLSGDISGWFSSSIFTKISDMFQPNKTAPTVNVTGADLVLATKNAFKWNYVSGYAEDEIPLGCTRRMLFNIKPNDASNKNYTYTLTGATSSQVIVTQEGSNLYIQPNELVNFTIECKTSDGNYISSKSFKTVELIAPQDYVVNESMTLVNGKSKQIEFTYSDVFIKNGNPEKLMPERYYDVSKLEFTSSNENVVSVNTQGYVIAHSVGTSLVTISDGIASKVINVEVANNEEAVVEPTSFEVSADKTTLGLQDMDNDRSPAEGEIYHSHISVNWGANTPTDDSLFYESSDPLIAKVDSLGNVRGYRKEGEAVITVRSVRNPSLFKEITFTSSPVLMTDFSLKNPETALEAIAKGKSRDISFNVTPSKATNKTFECSSENVSILTVTSKGSIINLTGINPGTTSFSVWPKDNPSLKKTFTIEVRPYSVADDPNYNEEHSAFRKNIGHFSAFLVDGVLLTLGLILLFGDKSLFKYFSYLISLTFGVSLAGLTEIIQHFVPTRNGNLTDVLIDSAGYFIGVLIILGIFMVIELVKFFIRRKKEKK